MNSRFRVAQAAAGLLLVLVAASSQAAAQTWVEFRQPEVGYSVEMPGKWIEQAQDIQTVMGPTKLNMAIVDLGKRAFVTMHSTYDADAVRKRPVAAILDGAREGAVANVKGKLRSEQKLTLNNHEGRQIVVEAASSQVVINRYVMVGNSLVQAIVAGIGDIENEPVVTRFLNSLKILAP